MTNKLSLNNRNELWDGSEESVFYHRYMIAIRQWLEVDYEANREAANASPSMNAKDELMRMANIKQMIHPNYEHIFDKALKNILDELDIWKKNQAGLILINQETGEAIVPISSDSIVEISAHSDDKTKKLTKKIVHPKITSSLGLAIQEQNREKELIFKALEPANKLAYKHLTHQDEIRQNVARILYEYGMQVDEWSSHDCCPVIEFGREFIDGVRQSPNVKFHRAHMFPIIIAKRVITMCNKHEKCELGPIYLRRNSSYRWYEMPVFIKSI